MNQDTHDFPKRDERLSAALAEAAPLRARSDEEWSSLHERIVNAAALPLARRHRSGWYAPMAERAGAFAAVAAVLLLVLGGLVYTTPRPDALMQPFADASPEAMDLLAAEEVRSFFPGMDDPDRLLEAAIAVR